MGLSTIPITLLFKTPSNQAFISSQIALWIIGSLITPPLHIFSLPTSNWGLIKIIKIASRFKISKHILLNYYFFVLFRIDTNLTLFNY